LNLGSLFAHLDLTNEKLSFSHQAQILEALVVPKLLTKFPCQGLQLAFYQD